MCGYLRTSVYVHVSAVPSKSRRGSRIPRSRNNGQLWASRHGCWEPNLGPRQEHQMLLSRRHLSSPTPFNGNSNNEMDTWKRSWWGIVVVSCLLALTRYSNIRILGRKSLFWLIGTTIHGDTGLQSTVTRNYNPWQERDTIQGKKGIQSMATRS